MKKFMFVLVTSLSMTLNAFAVQTVILAPCFNGTDMDVACVESKLSCDRDRSCDDNKILDAVFECNFESGFDIIRTQSPSEFYFQCLEEKMK